jgi:hypothetical protein
MLMQVECNRHHPMAVPVHNQDAIQLAIVLPLNNHFYGAVRAVPRKPQRQSKPVVGV